MKEIIIKTEISWKSTIKTLICLLSLESIRLLIISFIFFKGYEKK